MIIYPAIDIIDGKCVRLFKGDYDTVHEVYESPLAAAKSFEEQGATHLHVVDLDGAKNGYPTNIDTVKEIVENTNLIVDLGGGIRTMEHIKDWIDAGVSQIVLGSVALTNPSIVKEAVAQYGDKITVGIDAKRGFVAVNGWTKTSTIDFTVLASMMHQMGVNTIVYTDIAKDGMLEGPNLDHLASLRSLLPNLNLIASGGVSGIEDIKNLKELKVDGVICGKSIYSGRLDLAEAIEIGNIPPALRGREKKVMEKKAKKEAAKNK